MNQTKRVSFFMTMTNLSQNNQSVKFQDPTLSGLVCLIWILILKWSKSPLFLDTETIVQGKILIKRHIIIQLESAHSLGYPLIMLYSKRGSKL